MGSGKSDRDLLEAKLATSGLTLDDARALGIDLLDAKESAKLFEKVNVPSMLLNYHDIDGNRRDGIWRMRVLKKPTTAFGGEMEDLRYLQAKGTPPAAYFPTSLDWRAIANDSNLALLITEGELKAASACKAGYCCIGLGGVSSWKSASLGWSMLPELDDFKWGRRQVSIVFDSDATTKPQVAQAIGALTKALVTRGAIVRVAHLPVLLGYEKTGLDDFIVAKGEKAKEELDEILEKSSSGELARRLWEYNQRFTMVLDPGLVYDEQEQRRYDPARFKSLLFVNDTATEVVVTADGNARTREVRVAEAWIDWPARRQLVTVTYEPGKPNVIDGKRLNNWHGWGVEPKKGDVGPWKKLLDHLFIGAEPEARKWFESWCLYPIKFPGAKFKHAVGIWSITQGVGKSEIGETLGLVYGRENFVSVAQHELESDFNGLIANRQFVMVDDCTGHNNRGKADRLKKMISQYEINVNEKFVPTHKVTDCANFYLTSNRSDAFFVEDEDRRWFIHEVTSAKLPPEFWDRFFEWKGTIGPAALMYYAQEMHDFGDFKPYMPPPMTRAKAEMIYSVKGELDAWICELAEDPESKLYLGPVQLSRDVYSPAEITAIFDQTRKGSPVATNAMSRRLREKFPFCADGKTILVGKQRDRFFVVRNPEKWVRANPRKIAEHILEGRSKESSGKGARY